MNFNQLGFSTPRVLALVTVASVGGLGIVSGVFGTFSTTILSNNNCVPSYGYASGYGYGYGYDCTPIPPVIGGGGGGGSSYYPSTTVPKASTPATKPSESNTPNTPVVIRAKDIEKNEHKSSIEVLITKGIMNNSPRINPDRPISRAEFLKMLALANGYTPTKTIKRFRDLPSRNALAPYVQYGVAQGWVNVKHEDFRPNDVITQGEMEKLINAIKGKATADTIAVPTPKDTTRGKAASIIVNAFYKN